MSDQQAPPEEQKVPLLDVLHDLGSVIPAADLPNHSQLPQVVGAIVKVMSHAGVEVADELYPEEPAVVARPETADVVDRQKTKERLDRIENLLSQLVEAKAPSLSEEQQQG